MKKILIATSEFFPFIKAGGLGDACGALAKALKRLGHDVRVVLPRYWSIDPEHHKLKKRVSPMGVHMGTGQLWCEVLEGSVDDIPVYFVEHEQFFGRAGIYDDGIRAYDDNAARFGFFSRAAIQLCMDIQFQPDIIHCNDWPAALIPAYMKIWEPFNPFFSRTATVFCIHNIAHQGVFPAYFYPFLGLGFENFTEPKFESYGYINFMKGAIFYADAITTVSPTHAEEILTPEGGHGLAQYLARRRDDITGILNGVDYDCWDPRNDPYIPRQYSPETVNDKAVSKTHLQHEFGLEINPHVPIFGVVLRFVYQKGFHLMMPIIDSIVHSMRAQFVFLGRGEKYFEDFFGGLPARHGGRIGSWIGYTEEKAHLIKAGADFFLMPSLFEPCGLNQMYSMRYGTLPIVRATGGLKDTVDQYDERTGNGTGFRFENPDSGALYNTIGWAVSTYYDRPLHMRMMRTSAMQKTFSWIDSARKYESLYERAEARRHAWR